MRAIDPGTGVITIDNKSVSGEDILESPDWGLVSIMLGPNKPPRIAYMILPERPEEPEFCESAVFPGHISSVIEWHVVDEHRASRSIALTLETRRELFPFHVSHSGHHHILRTPSRSDSIRLSVCVLGLLMGVSVSDMSDAYRLIACHSVN